MDIFYLTLAYHDLLRKIFDKNNFKLHKNVTRGLDYYKEGKGFEITCSELGSSKQICGGGEYDGGVGFAIGIDRLLMLDLPTNYNKTFGVDVLSLKN